MLDEPRTYRRSPVQFILVMGILVIFGISVLRTFPRDNYILLIPFAVIIGIAFASTLHTMNQKTTISEDGISAQSIFGEKSLRWGEISRVSGRGHGIKLHNLDGDVTVTPSSQLPGYEEVVEWIGIKRPDLFDPQEYSEMKRNIPSMVLFAAFVLLLMITLLSVGVMSFYNNKNLAALFPLAFVLLTIFVVFGIFFFFQPQSLTLEGKSLRVKYLFKEKTLLADEVASVDLRYSQNKNGKNYFVQLTRMSGKKMRISGLNFSAPIVYLVLKNWHKKNTSIGLTVQRN